MIKDEKRTKIVATLGPATSKPETIEKLIMAGVNAFRLNFSHGTHEEHAQLISWIKEKRETLNKSVAILQDLSGPKIRVGEISNPPLKLVPGQTVILDTSIEESKGNRIPVTYKNFHNDVVAGHRLLLADGQMELEILDINPPQVHCRVIVGGELTSHKGINYPDGSFTLPALTEKDQKDLRFGLRHGVDYVALSFIKDPTDVELARKICEEEKRNVPLIAKIEKHEALKNFHGIVQVVDGVMVARGDLGVEIPLEQVPHEQKKIIRISNLYGKPVITATQMLLSMVHSPRPTRAETTDIANAILDGTDAIMLSEETATGKHPIKAVETMCRIARETEKHFPFYHSNVDIRELSANEIPQAISNGATTLAKNLESRFIICPTHSGFTARMISRFRPKAYIIGLTPSKETFYQLSLLWGVLPKLFNYKEHMGDLLEHSIDFVKQEGLLKPGEKFVITSGYPFGKGGGTKLIMADIAN
ncbi:MAG: pyruvate kinase [Calditrichaeota bacterium]|nr:MAG: pyruvate kinase [Calditrichota bacterium]